MALTKLTTDLIDSTIVTSVNGSTGAVTLGTGTDWQATAKTADFTAVAGEGYFVDTTSSAITVTLPSSPTAGDEVSFIDYGANASTNNITLDPGTLNLRGSTDDLILSTNGQALNLVYSEASKGWLVNYDAGGTLPFTQSFSADFLVVAGGAGATSDISGGGGAGGLRTSYGSTSGGGAVAESSLNIITNTNYNVTIGAGGAGIASQNVPATLNGSNSQFDSITSIGGGGPSRAGVDAASGGSGGGVARSHQGVYSAAPGTVGQGFAGGPDADAVAGAGGGGAGAAGSAASGGSNPSTGGAGGNGLAVSITGSSVTYAGGGGGGGYYTSGGIGGTGGGGNGGSGNANNNATNGVANTGGGAGGGEQNATAARSGGSGVVILRYPNTYTINIGSGIAGSTASDGSDSITTLTSGVGTISFS